MSTGMRADARDALRDTIPVAMGYLPLAAAYGLMLANTGIDWWWAPVSSLLIFAGAMQFLSVGLLAAHTPLAEIFIATLLVNFRHVFYGLSYPMDKLKRTPARVYGVFALTDETYSLLAGKADQNISGRRITLIQLFSHGYWILGSFVGALGAMALPDSIAGIEFSLTALFLVLTYEHAIKRENLPAVVMGVLASAVAFAIGGKQFLSVAMGVFLCLVLANYPIVSRKASRESGLRTSGSPDHGVDDAPAASDAVPSAAESR
ncbi:AzlC family ABC transporter permease [Luedemannella flava]|uniref:AzlC family ABC transporter permease n=1 Tax=Luedemannella flava TaxID=349316 RepID=UPI0031DF7F4F